MARSPADQAEAYKQATGRLRILVTRVVRHPPFFLGDVMSNFRSQRQLRQQLRASCHMPFFGGVLPYEVDGRWYYDGLFWASFLVPWRVPTPGDHVLKVSAIGNPTAHIRPPPLPVWWSVLPPAQSTLRALYDRGYQDAHRAFRDACTTGRGRASRLALSDRAKEAVLKLGPPSEAERKATGAVITAAVAKAWWQIFFGCACLLAPAFLIAVRRDALPSF